MLDWITAHPLLAGGLAVLAIAVLWVARPYVREVIIGLAGAPARVARGGALRLRAESRRIDARSKERVQEHLCAEHEERLSRLARQLEGRIQSDINRADTTLMRLRDSADAVIHAADGADPEKIADRIVAELKDPAEGDKAAEKPRGAAAVARAQSRLEAAVRDARSQARSLKPEARTILGATDKLRLIEHKLSRHAHEMNDAAEKYERLLTSEDRARSAGNASIVVPWFAALIVIAIAAAGAFLNFQLIARPMAELVGGGARIAGLSLPALAAITLILLEAAAGVVLMEAAGATEMLPVFRRMGRRMAAGFAVAALFFLAVFSVVEVALAFTREAILALDADVLRAATGATAEAAPAAEGLPVALIAQALLGAAIPWILAVVAIPAETVINNTRFIVEAAWKHILAGAGVILAAIGTLLRAASRGVMALYDLAIFPALATESLVRKRAAKDATDDDTPSAEERRARIRAVDDLEAEDAREAPSLAEQRVAVVGARS